MSLKIVLQTLPIVILILLIITILIPACMPNPDSQARVNEYKKTLQKTNDESSSSIAGIEKFTTFLQKIDDAEYVRENTAKVYAADAYLNDTLVTHHGPEEIKTYFLKTAEAMSQYQVSIDDIASSGNEHYVRWTMLFKAPQLNGGKSVESVGISHVRLNSAGQVIMHQDFWDSGMNIYGQIPVVGGIIETIRRRFEK